MPENAAYYLSVFITQGRAAAERARGEREEDGTKGMGNERKGTGSAHTHATVERRGMGRKMETLVINYLL